MIYSFSRKNENWNKNEKLAANLHDKKEYAKDLRNLKQALNHGLVLKNVQRVIKFNQKAWLKSYIYMNTELKKCKPWFGKGSWWKKTDE